MNARLVAKGFINGFKKRDELLFCQCTLQYAKKNFKYSLFVDADLTQHFKSIGALNDSGEMLSSHLTRMPQVLCVVNPVASIENGEIIYSGVLKIFSSYSIYKNGSSDNKLFWGSDE